MLFRISAIISLLANPVWAGADGHSYNLQPEVIGMDESQIVIYRGDASPTSDPTLSINNIVRCDLAPGGYMAINVKPESLVMLNIERLGDPYPSQVSFIARPGKRQFLKIAPRGSAASNLDDLLSTTADQGGSFIFVSGTESEASKTNLATGCLGGL